MVNQSKIRSQLLTEINQEESQRLRFDMYLQVNEIQKLYQGLDLIRQKPLAEKQRIIAENVGFLEDLQEEVMTKTQEVLSEIDLEPEMLALTEKYAGGVRDLFNLIQELQSISEQKSILV